MGKGKQAKNILLLILAGEAVFVLPFVLVRIFRPTYLDVFRLNNFELGSCFSVYGVVAMLSYALGGPLADRFRAATLMALALWLTAAGGFVQLTLTSLAALQALYGFWGFTTICLFWSALIKATRMWGADDQGTAFGLLDAGRGVVAVLVGVAGVSIFAAAVTGDVETLSAADRKAALHQVIFGVSLALVLLGAFVYRGFDEQETSRTRRPAALARQLRHTLAAPGVWLLGVVVLAAYTAYKITDFIPQLAHELLGFDQVESARLGTLLLVMRPLCALAFGLLADRWVRTRMLSGGFGLILAGALATLWVLASGMAAAAVPPLLVSIMLLVAITVAVVGTYGARALYFAVMRDSDIPLARTGMAVGFISVVGFTPDVFVGPVTGWMLDTYPGRSGYLQIFGLLAAMAVAGLAASSLLPQRRGDAAEPVYE